MLPIFNSLPYHSSQVQTNGIAATAPQQNMPSTQFQGNPSNLLPQIRSQMGIINHQTPIPLHNSNAHFGNGNNSFINTSSQNFPLQNGMPPLGQYPVGNGPQNLNSVAMNQLNISQLNGQFFPHNSINQSPFFNQNMSLPNGQFCLQNPMQNMSQFLQMQMPNLPLFQNQVSQGRGPQNPAFAVNQHLGMIHFNGIMQHGNQEQQRSIPNYVNASKQSPNMTQQLLENSSLQHAFCSVQPQEAQNFRPPIFTKSQGNPRKHNGISNTSTNGKHSQSRNIIRNPKLNASQGFTKSQTHHIQNAKGKFSFHNGLGGKGHNVDGAKRSGLANFSNQDRVEKKKSLSLHYTEQEIQQWREQRKKNYPSKTNLEKKLTKKMVETEITDKDAMLRRQQLKEILAKQAELGCEIADIPSHYLSDSEKQMHQFEENKRAFGKKGRSRNQFNKRGRFHENDRFTKKQRPAENNSANLNDQNNFHKMERLRTNDPPTRPIMNKRELTLLQKLLSADLKRDTAHLLQVFRFMVMNSFFKDRPEKPLRFPLTIVKESEGELVEEKSSHMEKVGFEGEKMITKKCNDNEADTVPHGNIDKAIEGAEEEEGEIID